MPTEKKEKILVITYYWPPSGGAGVQRWLKLTKYLSKLNFETHVLTVDPEKASYFQRDESLLKDIDPSVSVHHTNSFEPLNIYGSIVGKKKVPTAGFSNIDVQTWKSKLVAKIRSNLFIPDPRIGWKKYAIKRALNIIKQENITHIITTSPPHSVQVIGLELKRKLGESINWIVDFRDPWTDIYYYHLLQNSNYSHKKNMQLEKEVLETADQIITVSEGFKSLFLKKTDSISVDKINVISNAYDSDDFEETKNDQPSDSFLISYIGTVADNYNVEMLFNALSRLITANPNAPIQFKATGIISDNLKQIIIEKLGKEHVTFHAPVPHQFAIRAMREAHILLLLIPPKTGIVPGKTFEYMASGRRIICLGKEDSAHIIETCQAGASFDRNEEDKLVAYLQNSLDDFKQQIPFKNNTAEVVKYAWDYKAKQITTLLKQK